MTNSVDFLNQLLQSYQEHFDIEKPYRIHDEMYEAYAKFSVTNLLQVQVLSMVLSRQLFSDGYRYFYGY